MEFEWDNEKSRTNKDKHGIDFNAAREMWRDSNRVEIQSSFSHENRNILIGKIGRKLWTAIYTYRGNNIRIISVRRSREKETKLYEQKEVS